MTGKLVVGCDLDNTIFDLISPLLKKYNKKYNDDLSIRYISEYEISKFLKPECKNIFQEFAKKKLFKNIVLKKEVVDTLTEMNDKYELYFVTAAHPKTVRYRDKLLSRNLPWYSSGQLITCRNKSLIKLDVLIDDCDRNIAMSNATGILIKQPWNIASEYPHDLTCERFGKEVIEKIGGLIVNS